MNPMAKGKSKGRQSTIDEVLNAVVKKAANRIRKAGPRVSGLATASMMDVDNPTATSSSFPISRAEAQIGTGQHDAKRVRFGRSRTRTKTKTKKRKNRRLTNRSFNKRQKRLVRKIQKKSFLHKSGKNVTAMLCLKTSESALEEQGITAFNTGSLSVPVTTASEKLSDIKQILTQVAHRTAYSLPAGLPGVEVEHIEIGQELNATNPTGMNAMSANMFKDLKFFLKDCRNTFTLKNTASFTKIVDVYEFVCRKSVPVSYFSSTTVPGGLYDLKGGSITTNEMFFEAFYNSTERDWQGKFVSFNPNNIAWEPVHSYFARNYLTLESQDRYEIGAGGVIDIERHHKYNMSLNAFTVQKYGLLKGVSRFYVFVERGEPGFSGEDAKGSLAFTSDAESTTIITQAKRYEWTYSENSLTAITESNKEALRDSASAQNYADAQTTQDFYVTNG